MNADHLAVTVYTPESPLRHPAKLFRAMIADLGASRELAWRLFVRDTSAQYRQSVLGYLWAFLPSIVTTATFTFLNSQKILNIADTSIPYPAFVLTGMVLWQTFVDALNSPLKSVGAARAMLSKINFPREALLLGGVAEVLFNFAVRAILLVPIFLYYDLPLRSTIAAVPFAVLALVLLGMAIGMLLLPIGVLYTDVSRAISLVSSFWMLLTPVAYPAPDSGIGAFLAKWNPVSPILLTGREWLIGQTPSALPSFAVVTASSAVTLAAAWIMFRLALPHIIDRGGN